MHIRKILCQEFRISRRGNHGRVVRRKRAGREKHGKTLGSRIAFESGTKFAVCGDASGYKKRRHLIRGCRRQRFGDQIVHQGMLKRCNQVQCLLIQQRSIIFKCRLADSLQCCATRGNLRLHRVRFYIAQNRSLDSTVGKIEVRPLVLVLGSALAPVAMLNLRQRELDRKRITESG